MGSYLHLLLAFGAVLFFISTLLFSTDESNQTYIKSILLMYPLLAIDLTPGFISMSIFVFFSFIFVLFFYHRRLLDYTHKRIYSGLTLLFFLFLLLGLYLSQDLSRDSITALSEYAAIFLFAKVLIEECIYDPLFYNNVKKYLRITVLIALVFLIAQMYFGPAFSIAKSQNINVIAGVKIRYTSYFQDPQKFAQFLAASSFLFLIPTANGQITLNKSSVLFLITVIAIFFTGGRSALGGWVMAMTVVVMSSNTRFRILVLSISSLLFLVAYFYSDSFALFQRESTVADAYAFRFEIWKDAFAIFTDYPLVGIGTGNYANYVALYHPDQFWIADNVVTYFDHPESGYLKLLVEYGIIGFLILFLIILIPAISSIRLYRSTGRLSLILPIAAILSWMVGFYTVYSLGDIRIFVLVTAFVAMLIIERELYGAAVTV